jgi:hypothetical protein
MLVASDEDFFCFIWHRQSAIVVRFAEKCLPYIMMWENFEMLFRRKYHMRKSIRKITLLLAAALFLSTHEVLAQEKYVPAGADGRFDLSYKPRKSVNGATTQESKRISEKAERVAEYLRSIPACAALYTSVLQC